MRTWSAVHTWTSLISTLFLLMLCVTGLPLIFHEEIEHAFDPAPSHETGRRAPVDAMIAAAKQTNPGRIVSGLYVDPEHPVVSLYLVRSWEDVRDGSSDVVTASFDAVTGAPHPADVNPTEGFMTLMFRLHVDMFAALPGQLFLGLMGLLFIAAIVSGVVLYGPFTRKMKFGEVRHERRAKVRWLDLHNLLGIVTVAWASVVGVTGVMNELTGPLYANYLATDIAKMIAPWKGQTPPARDARLASVDTLLADIGRRWPDRTATFIEWPGNPFGTPHHYFVFTQGKDPIGSKMSVPVLADARSGALVGAAPTPWYLSAIELSRPFHFGDYGGLPLKILWALFDVVTILVLGSGVYLWAARRRPRAGTRRAAAPQLVPAE
jgi:uncharacterized iron-regulated membrane protein